MNVWSGIKPGREQRVSKYCTAIAEAVGLSDPGTIGLAARLRNSCRSIALSRDLDCSKLTDLQYSWETDATWADVGADLASIVGKSENVGIILKHQNHRWDGAGNPDGIGGRDIPIGSRILRVALDFDRYTSHVDPGLRLDVTHAIEELKGSSGNKYDPTVVAAFVNWLETSMERDNKARYATSTGGELRDVWHSLFC
jgi:response regulator RpfG family c-di-GMP phosphodiesterase